MSQFGETENLPISGLPHTHMHICVRSGDSYIYI